ncbi:MAG: iron donor protein CyaY [Vicinamibacterales bacterium]
MSATLTEPEFRLSADAALESLERALLPLCDEHDVEIELQNGVMQIVFEAPAPAKFIVSPNAPVRQIWVSAMSRSYKLSWAPDSNTFELAGEPLNVLLARLVGENLGLST